MVFDVELFIVLGMGIVSSGILVYLIKRLWDHYNQDE